ncbi:hypothetical protein HOU08_gp178 [Dickeya phage vB_DsoM_JA29]|uniref:Uncharacterized protein n=1 Tax=Dickeya phage vB_DsoM_JA29 TaxID=2283031 RepID=A0A384ZXE1_9CAUD|nr:hypothetical protein HOU08_gp178 [Dickeya phage vB_DsoM_JA29]AXG66904.1 hypothetical protein JA29_178 [Dickeya phage vB_DsoM_JA29]
MKTVVSISALQPSQYRNYMRGWKPDQRLLEIFEQQSHKRGKKAYRIYFDYAVERNIRIPDSHVPSSIAAFLRENNFELLDYAAGTVKDRHDRVQRLGKVLSKQPDLKKLFDNDANRRQIVTAAKGDKLVCLSMHPYDIAGMSTDRGWTSCMNLVDGSNKKFVERDVKANTLIAYMVNPEDKNVNKPIMRLLLKKFVNSNGSSFRYIAEVAYPDAKDTLFVKKVQEWVDQNINVVTDKSSGPAILSRKKDLYNDGGGDFTLTGIEKLVALSLDKLDDALDKLYTAKEKAAKARNSRPGGMHTTDESAMEFFKKIPAAISYKNISKLIPRAYEFWVKAIEENPKKESLLRDAFSKFKSAKQKTLAHDIMTTLAARQDFKSIQTANEAIPVEEFLKSGETDFLMDRLLDKANNAAKVLNIATGLADFSDDPEVTFWKILARVCGEESSDAFDSEDEITVYYFKTYYAVSKLHGKYATLASLKKAKKFLPRMFYSIWEFLVKPSDKTIAEFTFSELGADGYSERRSMLGDIFDWLDEYSPKPVLLISSIEAGGRTPVYVCFDKTTSADSFVQYLKKKAEPPEDARKVIQIPNGRFNAKRNDIEFEENGDWYSVYEFARDYDVRAVVSEDPKTNMPIATFIGDEFDVDFAINALQRLL